MKPIFVASSIAAAIAARTEFSSSESQGNCKDFDRLKSAATFKAPIKCGDEPGRKGFKESDYLFAELGNAGDCSKILEFNPPSGVSKSDAANSIIRGLSVRRQDKYPLQDVSQNSCRAEALNRAIDILLGTKATPASSSKSVSIKKNIFEKLVDVDERHKVVTSLILNISPAALGPEVQDNFQTALMAWAEAHNNNLIDPAYRAAFVLKEDDDALKENDTATLREKAATPGALCDGLKEKTFYSLTPFYPATEALAMSYAEPDVPAFLALPPAQLKELSLLQALVFAEVQGLTSGSVEARKRNHEARASFLQSVGGDSSFLQSGEEEEDIAVASFVENCGKNCGQSGTVYEWEPTWRRDKQEKPKKEKPKKEEDTPEPPAPKPKKQKPKKENPEENFSADEDKSSQDIVKIVVETTRRIRALKGCIPKDAPYDHCTADMHVKDCFDIVVDTDEKPEPVVEEPSGDDSPAPSPVEPSNDEGGQGFVPEPQDESTEDDVPPIEPTPPFEAERIEEEKLSRQWPEEPAVVETIVKPELKQEGTGEWRVMEDGAQLVFEAPDGFATRVINTPVVTNRIQSKEHADAAGRALQTKFEKELASLRSSVSASTNWAAKKKVQGYELRVEWVPEKMKFKNTIIAPREADLPDRI